MEDVNPLKETFLLGTLNVGLPTVDVYSDLALTTKLYLYEKRHYIYATSLLIPFFINYALGWRAWYYSKNQKYTSLSLPPTPNLWHAGSSGSLGGGQQRRGGRRRTLRGM